MTAEDLRKAILQQAIQGKLVPQNPNDEPASILLERIREEKARLVKEKKIKKDKNESIIYKGEDNSYYEKILATREVKCIDDEIPFEIPESWCWSRFSNIVNLNPNVQTEDDNDVAFIPMAYIKAGYSGEYTYEVKKWNDVKKGFTKISKGDIAYAKITPCFQNRKSFILEDVPSNVAAATTELNVLRIYENTLSTWFVLFFLKTDYFIKEAKLKGTAGQQRVIPEYVQNKLFPIAPLSEQNRIVSRIKDLLTIIERYEQSKIELDKLESELYPQLKKSILQYAIQGKLVPQDSNDEPASILLERIREEKTRLVKEKKIKKDKNESIIYKGEDNSYYEKTLATGEVKCIDDEIPFEIPNSWEWVRMGNITTIIGGYAFPSNSIKSNNGIRVIRISDFNNGKILEHKGVRYNGSLNLSQYQILEKDILMAMTGGTVGKCVLIPKMVKEPMLLNQRVALIRNFYIYEKYIYTILISNITQEVVNTKKNSTNDNISMEDIYKFLIPLPPLQEQRRIVAKIEKILNLQ